MSYNSQAMRVEMLEKPVGRLLFQKSYPTVIIQLITIIYNIADTYFVAKINTESTAAVGVVFSLMSIIQAVGFGIGMGASSLISRNLGAKKNKKADVYGSMAVFLGLLFGTLLMIAGLINLNGLMKMIGASETVLPYAASYATYILLPSLMGLGGIEMLQSTSDIMTFLISVPLQIWFFRRYLKEKEKE